jgi:hypothetical protein
VGSFAAGGAPGFGSSAWYSDVDGGGGERSYSNFRILPTTDVTDLALLSEISDIGYWTDWVGGTVDWRLTIYLPPAVQPTNPGDPWYSYRLNFNRGADSGDGWNSYSASSLGVEYVTAWGGGNSGPYTWSQIQGAFGNAPIAFIDFGAGYMTSGPASYSYLDGITIDFTEGSGRSDIGLDLAAVPEPASMAILGMGLVGLVATRMRKRQAV